jgi:hypothetical protein
MAVVEDAGGAMLVSVWGSERYVVQCTRQTGDGGGIKEGNATSQSVWWQRGLLFSPRFSAYLEIEEGTVVGGAQNSDVLSY